MSNTDPNHVPVLTDAERIDRLIHQGIIPVKCYADARYTLGEFEGESPQRDVVDRFLAACETARSCMRADV